MKDHREQPGVVEEQSDSCYAICPYCGSATGDVDEWVTQVEEDAECFECGETYSVRAEYSVEIHTSPID